MRFTRAQSVVHMPLLAPPSTFLVPWLKWSVSPLKLLDLLVNPLVRLPPPQVLVLVLPLPLPVGAIWSVCLAAPSSSPIITCQRLGLDRGMGAAEAACGDRAS